MSILPLILTENKVYNYTIEYLTYACYLLLSEAIQWITVLSIVFTEQTSWSGFQVLLLYKENHNVLNCGTY